LAWNLAASNALASRAAWAAWGSPLLGGQVFLLFPALNLCRPPLAFFYGAAALRSTAAAFFRAACTAAKALSSTMRSATATASRAVRSAFSARRQASAALSAGSRYAEEE